MIPLNFHPGFVTRKLVYYRFVTRKLENWYTIVGRKKFGGAV